MIRNFTLIAVALTAFGAYAQDLGVKGHTEWSVPPYTVRLDTNLDEAGPSDELTVLDKGAPIYHAAGAFLRSELTAGQETIADDFGEPRPGHELEHVPDNDVLGLGIPNLVFAGYSGGMHCCFRAIILMLGQPFRVQTIDLYDPGGNFHPVDGRKSLVLEATDAAFKEWRSSSADSPFPTVMLSFDRAAGRYVVDPELMRAPLPPPEELARLTSRARENQQVTLNAGFTDYEVGALTSPMLDMIYTGHIAEAHVFLTEAWVGNAEQREAYWSLLTRCKLRTSDYWPAVAKINGLAADPPAKDCPSRF